MKILIWASILWHIRFGIYDNFHFVGVFWDTSDLDSLTIFILGGYSGTPRIWTLWQFSFAGVFSDTLDLDSMTIFILVGYSGTPQIWTLWQFWFWGGILGHLRFGLSDNIHLGVFWDTSDLDSMTIFIWGEYSGTPWIFILWQFSFWGGSILGHPFFLTPREFSFWGYLGHLGFGLYDNFHFGGLFWDTLDLDSMTIFIWGYSGTPWIWTLWQFSFGGILWHLGFGLYDNFHLGGILECLRFGLYDNFHLGRILEHIEFKSKVSLNTPPKWKIVKESKSEVSQNTPKWKLSGSPNPRCPRILPPKMKIVRESKPKVSQNTPPKWKLS